MSAESGSPITTYFRVCDGVRIRFADTGADSDTTLLPEPVKSNETLGRRV